MLYSPVAMHMPDGFLSVLVSIAMWLVSAFAVGLALRHVGATVGTRQVPLMGVLAACIFAGQMLNFAVAGGTSGHLLGAALATILVGPWAAILVMTSVVGLQALVFQDGGLLALGANIFNMAVIGVSVSYAVYKLIRWLAAGRRWGLHVGGFAAAWTSIFIASLAAALELAVSGTSPANIAVPVMAAIHALIGVGEALITVGALVFIHAGKRELLGGGSVRAGGETPILVAGVVLALLLAVLSPLASAHPDGLEWVAGELGILGLARSPSFEIIPDYIMPGIDNESLATITAGVIGVALLMLVALAFARYRRRAAQSR
jgi:cobalt/nickel transport system permease protein